MADQGGWGIDNETDYIILLVTQYLYKLHTLYTWHTNYRLNTYESKDRRTRGSLLPQHGTVTRSRSKAPFVCTNDFLRKNYVAQQNFCSLISNWCDMREQAPGANLLHESVQEQAPWCVLKFASRDMTCLQLANQISLFFYFFFHPVLVEVLTRERVSGACFRSKLPRVYRS